MQFFHFLVVQQTIRTKSYSSIVLLLSDFYSVHKVQLSWLELRSDFTRAGRSDIHQVLEQIGEQANCAIGSSQVCPFEFRRQRSMMQWSYPRKIVDPWDRQAKTNNISVELISVRESRGKTSIAGDLKFIEMFLLLIAVVATNILWYPSNYKELDIGSCTISKISGFHHSSI